MLNYIASILLIIAILLGAMFVENGLLGILVILPLVIAALLFIRRYTDDCGFLLKIFVGGLLARLVVSSIIVGFGLQETFGEDSLVHELHGFQLWQSWVDGAQLPYYLRDWSRPWGLHILIATIYSVFGRVPILVNFVGDVLGAGTAVLVHSIGWHIFRNRTTARVAALLTAFFPAMLIWSSQIMKDGYVVFFVVLTMLLLIRLQEKFRLLDMILIFVSLGAILSVRFYIFYFAALACVASIVFGRSYANKNRARAVIIFSAVIVVIAYTGLVNVGREQVDKLSNLESIQYSRSALSKDAASGYGKDSDITTASGMAMALPVGLVNLLLAPFPWQFTSIRSAMTLPEMFVWWALFPTMILGAGYTFKNRFSTAIPIFTFAMALTIAYALFQTNVGTAYRQRTQIQVFLFIFIAVGWTILKERRNDRKLEARNRQIEFERLLRGQKLES